MVLSERVDEVVLPGEEGEFGVMPQHTPFLTSLRIGAVTVYNDGSTSKLATGKGMVEVTGKKVIILAQQAVAADEVDSSGVSQEVQDLEAKLGEMNSDDEDYEATKDKLAFAQYKQKIVA